LLIRSLPISKDTQEGGHKLLLFGETPIMS
jgi:hypothetical protein